MRDPLELSLELAREGHLIVNQQLSMVVARISLSLSLSLSLILTTNQIKFVKLEPTKHRATVVIAFSQSAGQQAPKHANEHEASLRKSINRLCVRPAFSRNGGGALKENKADRISSLSIAFEKFSSYIMIKWPAHKLDWLDLDQEPALAEVCVRFALGGLDESGAPRIHLCALPGRPKKPNNRDRKRLRIR